MLTTKIIKGYKNERALKYRFIYDMYYRFRSNCDIVTICEYYDKSIVKMKELIKRSDYVRRYTTENGVIMVSLSREEKRNIDNRPWVNITNHSEIIHKYIVEKGRPTLTEYLLFVSKYCNVSRVTEASLRSLIGRIYKQVKKPS